MMMTCEEKDKVERIKENLICEEKTTDRDDLDEAAETGETGGTDGTDELDKQR